jgi:YcxB-like protein
MDEEKIEIEVELTFEDFFHAIVSRSYNVRWIFVVIALLVIVPLVLFSIIFSYVNGKWFVTSVMLGLPILIFSGVFYNFYRIAKRLATKSKSKIQWSFSDFGYNLVTENGTAQVNWNGVDEIVETTKHFLLIIQNPIYIIVPKRFFTESQITEFRELVRRTLGDKAKLNG